MSHLILLVMLAGFAWFARRAMRGGRITPPGGDAPSAADFAAEVAKELAPFLPKEAAEAIRTMADQAARQAEKQRETRGDSPRRDTSPLAQLEAAAKAAADGALGTIVEAAIETAVTSRLDRRIEKHKKKQQQRQRQGHNPLAVVPPIGMSLHGDEHRRRARQPSVMAMAHGGGLCSPTF